MSPAAVVPAQAGTHNHQGFGYRWPCHIALLRRMGPRLRGDDSGESLLRVFLRGNERSLWLDVTQTSRRLAAALVFLLMSAGVQAQAPEPLRPYAVVGNAIPAPLTGVRGDPARGRAIVGNRQVGLCLLCHSGPFPEEKFQGTLAPDLKGAGGRWSEGQLRLRIVDSSRLYPDTM